MMIRINGMGIHLPFFVCGTITYLGYIEITMKLTQSDEIFEMIVVSEADRREIFPD